MRSLCAAVTVATALLLATPAEAGKVDEVKKVVKERCGYDIAEDQLLSAVVSAFDCQGGQDVIVAGCKVKCLKGGSGKVVGDK